MGSAKNPGRILDGPYAGWGAQDENCIVLLSNATAPATTTSTNVIRLGQAVYLDVTQFGPDSNVMKNSQGPASNSVLAEQEEGEPLGEVCVPSQAGNHGPIFGVVTQVYPTNGLTFSYDSGGVPMWTNTTGKQLLVNATVRQQGFAYVWVGARVAITAPAVLVGSTLTINSTNNFACANVSPGLLQTIGVALASAVNTYQMTGNVFTQSSQAASAKAVAIAAPQGPGQVSIVPQNMAGIIPGRVLLIDTAASGLQETVSVGSVSYPAFSTSLVNAHTGNFPITGPLSPISTSTVLISTAGTNVTATGLVAAWVSIT